jgi:hypothetical protein
MVGSSLRGRLYIMRRIMLGALIILCVSASGPMIKDVGCYDQGGSESWLDEDAGDWQRANNLGAENRNQQYGNGGLIPTPPPQNAQGPALGSQSPQRKRRGILRALFPWLGRARRTNTQQLQTKVQPRRQAPSQVGYDRAPTSNLIKPRINGRNTYKPRRAVRGSSGLIKPRITGYGAAAPPSAHVRYQQAGQIKETTSRYRPASSVGAPSGLIKPTLPGTRRQSSKSYGSADNRRQPVTPQYRHAVANRPRARRPVAAVPQKSMQAAPPAQSTTASWARRQWIKQMRHSQDDDDF